MKQDDRIIGFGSHFGELWSSVPVGYINFIIKEKHSKADLARTEIFRRMKEGESSLDESQKILARLVKATYILCAKHGDDLPVELSDAIRTLSMNNASENI